MVTKSKKHGKGEKEAKKGRVKVGKLKLDRETIKDLTGDEARRIKGGMGGRSGTCVDVRSGTCVDARTGGCIAD
jgi:hypothetical protein